MASKKELENIINELKDKVFKLDSTLGTVISSLVTIGIIEQDPISYYYKSYSAKEESFSDKLQKADERQAYALVNLLLEHLKLEPKEIQAKWILEKK
jgi:hypothetical protein